MDVSEKSYWTKRRKILSNVDSLFCNSVDASCATVVPAYVPEISSSSSAIGSTVIPAVISASADASCSHQTDDVAVSAADMTDTMSVLSDWSTHDSDELADDSELRGELLKWYLRYNISLDALGALLKLLHEYHPTLPIDARTLLKTPDTRTLNVKQIPGGNYYHFGIANGHQNLFEQGYIDSNQGHREISLQINIDGLPLFKSTNYQFWPILGMVIDLPVKRPFAIGLYGGNHKPSDLAQYLDDFVKECQHLETNGIVVGICVFAFKIHSIVCDAPARSFVRQTKGHNAYGGCDRCRQVGLWLDRVILPNTNAEKRTDAGFRNKIDEEYHIGETPILNLSIDIVQQLPLDYMHLVCLGVMRRLLVTWLKGPLACRLPGKSVLKISDRLLSMRQCVPSEFCRRPRPLSEMDRYKATEFRQMLLYTGLVAFRGIVADEVYHHFLLLSIAIRCLASDQLCQSHADYANKLLVMFVEYAAQLYGQEFVVYNVHCLVHVSDDVKHFGPLDKISCFPYENYLKHVKKMVRSSHLPFQQVLRRLAELNSVHISNKDSLNCICQYEHDMGPVVDGYEQCIQHRSVRMPNFSLNLSDRDSCVVVDDGCVGMVRNILSLKSEVYLVLCLFRDVGDLFDYPLLSSEVGIYRVSHLRERLHVFGLNRIRCKCVRLPVADSHYAVVPLVHASC